MNKNSKIYIAGHRGMVGSAMVRKLIAEGYTNLIYKTSEELDLKNQVAVNNFFYHEQPEYVYLIAANVGGINAKISSHTEFLYDNLMIQSNTIHSAHLFNVKKILFSMQQNQME